MYTLARKHMDVDELFEEVEKEINSSHEYLEIQEAEQETRATTRLTVVATVGMVLAVATGFLGMNIWIMDWKKHSWLVFILTMAGSTFLLLLTIKCSNRLYKYFDRLARQKPKKK